MENLDQIIKEEAGKCILCGACQSVCPVYAELLDESQVARGRMALLKAVFAGKLTETDRLDRILSACIGCKACSAQCPAGSQADSANLAAKLRIRRSEGLPYYQKILSRQVFSRAKLRSAFAGLLDLLGRKIYAPLSHHRGFQSALPYVRNGKGRNIPRHSATPFHKRPFLPPVTGVLKGKVTLFYGCAVDTFYPQWGKEAVTLLHHAGIEVEVPETQSCCGAPLLFMGDREGAARMAKQNLAALSGMNTEAVITLCATCGSTLKELYPKLFPGKTPETLAGRIMDFQEYWIQKGLPIPSIKEKPDNSPPLRVTYHDPCHLNRGMGIREAPRTILQHLPGIEYIEMEDADRCCGGGGLFSLRHYDLSLKIGRHKVDRIVESGADIVATACPSCQIQLEDLLRRAGLDTRVVHVCELLHGSEKGKTQFALHRKERKL
ncbi:MAG: (Fe-S)-binding protein [Deltaproteobacteria bacterium]|nr:(Fe-S)-binding protein [Deltaproteobacteria bacterium]